jgi:hypothetical protein
MNLYLGFESSLDKRNEEPFVSSSSPQSLSIALGTDLLASSGVIAVAVVAADFSCGFRKAAFHAARFSGEFTQREKSTM